MTGSLVVISKMRGAKQEGEELSEVPQPVSGGRTATRVGLTAKSIHRPTDHTLPSLLWTALPVTYYPDWVSAFPFLFPSSVSTGKRGACVCACVCIFLPLTLSMIPCAVTHSHLTFPCLPPSPPPSLHLTEEACEEEVRAVWDVL